MALGGGTYIRQDKVLPGAYINFISAARTQAAVSDRGIVAVPLEMDWGADGEIFEITLESLQKDAKKIFGYSYTSEKLKNIRELFCNATLAYCYRINSGVQASNPYGTAKYTGILGNELKIVIQSNIDESNKYDVITYFGSDKVDSQTVSAATELLDNDYVIFKRNATLQATAGEAFTGGENGEVTGEAHQSFLNKIESYGFHCLCCPSNDEATKSLYIAYTKRMRDEIGAKFQTVIYNKAADYEGIVNVKNKVEDKEASENALIYWVAGAIAGCAINRSNTNKAYDGEYLIHTDFRQEELKTALKNGEFVLHKVGQEVRVLSDINSHTSFTNEKSEDFQSNQTVRVLDQIAVDIASLFNEKYLGKVQNNESGRAALLVDLITYYKELENRQAIEGFDREDITIEKGDKKSIVINNAVTPVNCMEKLYMSVIVA